MSKQSLLYRKTEHATKKQKTASFHEFT